jgi:hypothetical protein
MAKNPITLLLSDTVTCAVFQEILKNRSAILKHLRQTVAAQNRVLPSEIDRAVEGLLDADLVKEHRAEISDFNSYYVTADGLSAERQLRLALAS